MDAENVKDRLATRLRELRQAAGMAQDELARVAGNMSRAYVSELERGEKAATVETMARLAQALGVDVSDLLRKERRPRATTNPKSPEERLGQLVTELARGADQRSIKKFTGIARVFFSG